MPEPESPREDALGHGGRRGFLKTSALALAGVGAVVTVPWPVAEAARAGRPKRGRLLARNDVILFQGDSITDAGRSRAEAATANARGALGSGYAWLAGAALLVDRPGEGFQVYNRGISGNKVFQLADRWGVDCLDLKPKLLSILIGVNDFWHTLDGKYHGTVEIYERDYRTLLERTRQALPQIRLVICEPFVLRCGAVNEHWFPSFDQYRAAAKRVAKAYADAFVPFQAMFEEAVRLAPPEEWAKDGVHPTGAGASLMAHFWLEAVGELAG